MFRGELNPAAMVTQGKELVAAYGVMGGYMQPQGHLQVLMYA